MTMATAVWPCPGGYGVEVKRTGTATRRRRHHHHRAGHLRGRDIWHAEAAAPDEGDRRAAAAVRLPGRCQPDQLRSDPRRGTHCPPRRRPLARGCDHVLLPPGRAHAHRAHQVRRRARTRWGRCSSLLIDGGGRAPRWAKFLGQAAARPAGTAPLFNLRHWSERTIIALVMQSRDNSITVRARRGPLGWGMRAGARARRAEPHLDPGGPPGGPDARRGDRRLRRRHLARPVRHPDHGAFHRRCRDRRLAVDRRHRRLPPRTTGTKDCTWSMAPPSRPTPG